MPDRDDTRLRELALRIAEMAPEPPPYPGNAPRPRRRPRRRLGWALAGFAAVAVGIGLPVWLLAPDDGATRAVREQTFEVPGPVELAVGDVVWPAKDTVGSPSGVAVMFAREVLGWRQASASEGETGSCVATPSGRGESCWEASVAVTLTQPGVAPLELIMLPIGENADGRLWAVMQIGPGYTTDRLQAAPGGGSRIPLPPVEHAATADITMRIAEQDALVVVTADSQELAEGFSDSESVTDPAEVLTVLVRYRDADGHVISAVGGPWNEFYEWPPPEPAGPEVVVAEGRYEGSERTWRLSAFRTNDNTLCIRLEGMSCVVPPDQSSHLSALSIVTSSGAGQVERWCVFGPVVAAAAVELRLPDESTIAAPIYSSDSFDVDFFAYCSLGAQPPNQAAALDAQGNVLATTGTPVVSPGP